MTIEADRHQVATEIDFRLWLTSKAYNDELHQQSLTAWRDLGRRMADRVNQIVLDVMERAT